MGLGVRTRNTCAPLQGRETLPIREHALPRPNRNWPSQVCWEMDMIADVSMRMPAAIRHNIAPECQEARAASTRYGMHTTHMPPSSWGGGAPEGGGGEGAVKLPMDFRS